MSVRLSHQGLPAVHAWRQGLWCACTEYTECLGMRFAASLRALLSPFIGRSCYECQHVSFFGYMLMICSVLVFGVHPLFRVL